MPEPQPTENTLSEPVEPIFRQLIAKVIDESFCYSAHKYGTELKTFNGRRELQDLAEELISGLRYGTQLAMRCYKLEGLLIQALDIFRAHYMDEASGHDIATFMSELEAVVDYATRKRPE